MALVSVMMVAILYLRSWIIAARSTGLWLLLWCCLDSWTSVSILVDWELLMVSRDAIAVLNWSTASVISVLRAVISVLIARISAVWSWLVTGIGCELQGLLAEVVTVFVDEEALVD